MLRLGRPKEASEVWQGTAVEGSTWRLAAATGHLVEMAVALEAVDMLCRRIRTNWPGCWSSEDTLDKVEVAATFQKAGMLIAE